MSLGSVIDGKYYSKLTPADCVILFPNTKRLGGAIIILPKSTFENGCLPRMWLRGLFSKGAFLITVVGLHPVRLITYVSSQNNNA